MCTEVMVQIGTDVYWSDGTDWYRCVLKWWYKLVQMCTEVMVQIGTDVYWSDGTNWYRCVLKWQYKFGHCGGDGCKFLQHVGTNEACYICKNRNDNHHFEQLLLW